MLIVLPSIVSGIGVAFVLAAILVNQQVVQDVFLSTGVSLLWADFFVTMAIFRRSMRSIDRRLRRIEARLDDGVSGGGKEHERDGGAARGDQPK
ncbi:MAG: hypothetical protein HYX53_04345 [Chloroflexi bacterium]|nr:hypothetical protein [Chloroflexota bacterium]